MHFLRENNTGTIYLKIKMIRRPYFTHNGGFFRGREENWVNVSEETQCCFYCSFWLKRRILYLRVWRTCRRFLFSTESWYIPRLETFANCDPTAPEYLVGFVKFFSSLSPSLKTEKNICEGCCWGQSFSFWNHLIVCQLPALTFSLTSHGLAAEEESAASSILPSEATA